MDFLGALKFCGNKKPLRHGTNFPCLQRIVGTIKIPLPAAIVELAILGGHVGSKGVSMGTAPSSQSHVGLNSYVDNLMLKIIAAIFGNPTIG